jgi:hypothetical protein
MRLKRGLLVKRVEVKKSGMERVRVKRLGVKSKGLEK